MKKKSSNKSKVISKVLKKCINKTNKQNNNIKWKKDEAKQGRKKNKN